MFLRPPGSTRTYTLFPYTTLFRSILTLAQGRAKSQIEKPLQVAIVGADRAPELVKWLAAEGIERKTLDGDPDAAIRSQDEDAYLRIGDDFGEQWKIGRAHV